VTPPAFPGNLPSCFFGLTCFTIVTYDSIEKFDGRNDFTLWRVRMKALLVQQWLSKALRGKHALPKSLSEDEKE
jgi:hypothetical protein